MFLKLTSNIIIFSLLSYNPILALSWNVEFLGIVQCR